MNITGMTDEQKRIAIAKICGWTIRQITCAGIKDIGILPPGVKPKGGISFFDYAGIDIPDYLNSLDAMHEAEKTLSPNQIDLYADRLTTLISPHRISGFGNPENGSPQLAWPGVFQIIQATARQRADAFLLTLPTPPPTQTK